MRTYVFRPVAEGRYPGLVFFSEIFQVTGPIRRTAAILAGHGFVVAVPEVYHELVPGPGVVLAYDQAGADQDVVAAAGEVFRPQLHCRCKENRGGRTTHRRAGDCVLTAAAARTSS